MNGGETARGVEVPLSALVELAIDCWRFERWVTGQTEAGGAAAHARLAVRRWGRFLSEREVSVADVTGVPYEAGLAVEVIDVVDDRDAPVGTEVVDETVAPIVMWRGTVVRHGQVIVRRHGGPQER